MSSLKVRSYASGGSSYALPPFGTGAVFGRLGRPPTGTSHDAPPTIGIAPKIARAGPDARTWRIVGVNHGAGNDLKPAMRGTPSGTCPFGPRSVTIQKSLSPSAGPWYRSEPMPPR